MEVLQCDGCDFHAESYDDLKIHIQEVHTAFLQPADADESESPKDDDEEEVPDDEEDDRESYDKHSSSSLPGMSPNSETPKEKDPSESTLSFYQCKFCVRYFRSKSFLKNHTKKVHNIRDDQSDVHNSRETSKDPSYTVVTHNDHSKVYSCQYCTYKSPRKARIIKHQIMYHQVPSEGAEDHSNDAEAGDDCLSAGAYLGGTFACEWCDFQTDEKDSWTDHVAKEHSDKVKIISSVEELEGEASSSKPDSPSSPRSPASEGGIDGSTGRVTPVNTMGTPDNNASVFHYVMPNSTGSSILSKRFPMADSNCSPVLEMDASLRNEEDSRSSMEEDDEELVDIDDPSYTGTLSADVKQLLTDEDNKVLETKGVQIRKQINRFQCPFCSFLTMHRRSISRHIENIHFSGKTTVYKCDECPFICTSSLKLGTHKQSHGGSDVDTMDITNSVDTQNEPAAESLNGGNVIAKVNGKRSSPANDHPNPHQCSLCSFSTTTLKGLRVHQQHKHSYCDDVETEAFEEASADQPDTEVENSPTFLQKTQTSILRPSTKKNPATGKRARKSINDLPLDLSSVKKRTRIDEIASNLQSKISQSQQDMIINLDELDDEEGGGSHRVDDHDDSNLTAINPVFTYNIQQIHVSEPTIQGGRVGKRKSNPKSKPRNIPISLTLSDDSENVSGDLTELQDNGNQDSRDTFQENAEYSEDPGAVRFYCKHCDYHNKSARSVSTHYQRMHPYIKFSFKYILDPEDHSAVFRCLECYIEYPNYNDLHQHYMDHHPEASNVLNFNQPDLVYMCRFCAYTSPNVRSLMPHYQRMHPTVKINNAMIFSSYVVEQSHKTGESQTLREILNSGPKNFTSATSTPRSSSSPALKSPSKTPEASVDSEALKEAMGGNVVVYECDVCSFASPNMHSVLVHYQKKHPEQKASYFRIQKTMKIITTDKAQSPAANSSFNVSSTSSPSKSSSATTYGTEEDIYYCKHCVYSNRSVVGVLVHYQKRHPEVKVTAKYIKHGAPTPVLMKLIDDLQIATPKQFSKPFQSNGYDGSFNSSPKIGNGEKGEAEMLFFCQHCDYGNRTVKGVLIHYQKKHRDAKANADLVRRHTAVVRSQRERAQMVQSGTVATTITQAPVDPESSGELRSLLCRHCPYTSPYVYALKKHLKKEHPTVKATAMTILHWAYQDGILEAGYHCEWCIYSHAEPQGLLLHYQRRHPEHNVDYTYMASKLWAGPETTQQGPNSLENKHFRCQECAFEACTIWDITSHYQAVHPWAMKAEESVIFDMIKGNITTDKILQQLVNDHAPSSGQSEDDGALIIASPLPETISHPTHPRLCISNNPYQCTVCLSEYNSLHGLLTHYGKKHPGMKVKAADFAQEADINPSSVYKCRHCPYVNSRIHGVLTHYQKRHPLVKVTAEDFADDIEHIADLNEGEDKCKTQRQGYGAYRCKICTYTHGTLEKLKIHYEKYHNQPAAEMFPHTFSSFSPSKEGEPVAECSVSNVSAVTDMLEVKEYELPKSEKHAIFKCQLCKYFCSTRKGIARHYRIKHNNVRAQPEGKNNVFKCALCSYTNPIRKGLAAHYQKRHDIDAYYTHCLAASKTLSDKPVKVMAPEKETTEMSEDLRLAVETRKCSLCSFQAFSRKSIVSHYIKRHPGVFPKKQHSSKLGRYFTLIYAKEPENPPETAALEEEEEEVKEEFEVQSMSNHQADEEWPPFKCLKCGQLSFDTIELLSMHYNDDHSSDLKRDFQSNAGEDGSELHQCSHCELKFLELPVLAKHIVDHNDDFQKKALKQERRRLLSKQKALELAEGKSEKQESPVNKAPIGFRCNFCVEVHPTLRAICNHLRKHVQYGEVKQGHVKMETSEEPLTPQPPPESLTNGQPEEEVAQGAEGVCLDDGDAVDDDPSPNAQDLLRITTLDPPPDPAATAGPPVALRPPEDDQDDQLSAGAVAMATTPTPATTPAPSAVAGGGGGGLAGALVAAARAVVAGGGQPKQQRLAAAGGYPCGQCDRVFMSMQGLRSHERSHSAMALFSREDKYSCQYCQFVSPFRHNLDRHVQSHHGHHKPFKCKFCPFKSSYLSRLKSHLHKAHAGEHSSAYQCLSCPFSSTTISLLKEHSLRDHGEELTLSKLRAATQAALRTPKLAGEDAELPGALGPEDPLYLEPADVRQQLTHYQMASQQSSAPAHGGSPTASDSRPDAVLTCEFCEFSSGYMQSLRRHYRDRHGGKKLFKCKDCAFFTCYKNTFTTHVAAGHAPSASDEPARDLRCPLCLYHTKHKSNMIDHVVLHREERTVPLEVSRSKLSRHLQGLVFRCQQCTFTCSSNKALQQHLLKHTVLRPYHCQLCYYDSGRRDQLEEHLRLEHKVVRNFELMGRVNLDQLEMMKDFSSSAEEEGEKQEQQQEDQEEGEEEMMAVDMVTDGRVSFEEQEEGEDGEDMEAAESAEAEQGEANDGVMAEHEEEVERVEGEVAVKEVTEKPVTQEDTASPGSCCSSSSGLAGLEKRLPCEFCGRCFTNSTEWERHVLRHGMLLNPMDTDPSAAPDVLEAPGPPAAETSFPTDPGLDLSSHRKEEQVKRKRKEEEEEDNGPSTDSLQTTPDQYMENKESL